jgi:hypothetical protein
MLTSYDHVQTQFMYWAFMAQKLNARNAGLVAGDSVPSQYLLHLEGLIESRLFDRHEQDGIEDLTIVGKFITT